MKHVKFEPNINDWEIPALIGIDRCIKRAIVQVLKYAFEDDETYIYFPVEWSQELDQDDPEDFEGGGDGLGGKEVTDPLNVYLRLGLDNGAEKPTYEFNLREALKDTMAACKEDGSFSTGLGRLSVALRAFAEEIDEIIKQGGN